MAAGWISAAVVLGAQYGREAGLAQPGDEGKYIGVLNEADASLQSRARACQQLSLIGTPKAVSALAPFLSDPRLSQYARDALEAIADASADDALREALNKVQGPLLIGVVNSLGIRGDVRAVPNLAQLVRDPSRGAAAEALLALARIKGSEAESVVRESFTTGPKELRAAAAEACLLRAEAALKEGKLKSAASLYDLVRQADTPSPLRLASTRGALLSRSPDEAVPLLLEQLKSEQAEVRDIALRASREIPDKAITRALADALGNVGAGLQPALIRVLADRGDSSVATTLERYARSDRADARLSSLEALGTVGAASSVPVLLDAVRGEGAEGDAAAASLARISAKETDALLLKTLPEAPVATKVRLIGILAQRRARSAIPELLAQTRNAEPAIGKAAYDALGVIGSPGDLPQVLREAVRVKNTEVREKAERAIYTLCMKNSDARHRSDVVEEAYGSAPDGTARSSLVQVLGMICDPVAYRVIASAYQQGEPEVREAAFRQLIYWPDPTPTPLLIDVYKSTTNDVHRTLALRGIVTLATQWADESNRPRGQKARVIQPPRESIDWLTTANAAVRDLADEKKIILSGLGSLNCVEGLRLLKPYLSDAAVRHDAELAILRACKGVTSSEEKSAARPLLEDIVSNTKNADARKAAEELLRAHNGSGS